MPPEQSTSSFSAAQAIPFAGILAPGSPIGEAIFGFSKPPSEVSGFVVNSLFELLVSAPEVLEDLFNLSAREIALNLVHAQEQAALELGRDAPPVSSLSPGVQALLRDLGEGLDFITPESLSIESLFGTLAQLLLKPPRVPGEPCLAPAPLLRDLLDIALGRITGGISTTVAKLKAGAMDLLIPADARGEELAGFVQAVLDDPVTAALNLVLGQRDRIDCEVTARKDVGESVIEMGFKRLVKFTEEALA